MVNRAMVDSKVDSKTALRGRSLTMIWFALRFALKPLV